MWAIIFLYLIFGIWSPLFAQEATQTGPRFSGLQALNPEISLDGLFAAGYFSEPDNLQFGAHDPNERGFTLQNLELTMADNVDPYFRAESHLIFGFEGGESVVEIEEAYVTTLSLPYGLQIIGGQFFTRFGRQNPIHPHAWDFADQTIVSTLMFGGDGLRNPGVQVSSLLPLHFYLEMIGSVQNGKGETATSFLFSPEETFAGRPIVKQEVHGLDDLLYMARLKTSFDLTETISLVAGTSHLFGSNGTGEDERTSIHGVDLYLKWRPLIADHGWPFVILQAEAMERSYEAGEVILSDGAFLSGKRFDNSGFYIQSLYGFKRRWVTGFRLEFADATDPIDPATGNRWRASTDLTFYPSEFSKIRFQYNYDKSDDLDDPIHALFLQFEFLTGAHGAHTF